MSEQIINKEQMASAWHGSHSNKSSFEVLITQKHLDAFDHLLTSLSDHKPEEIQPAQANLNAIKSDLASWYRRIKNESGLLILRDFPRDRYSSEQLAKIFWCVGLQMGTPMSQSVAGDRLGHVVGIGGKDYSERAYRSRVELDMHTDACDIVGMLCLQKAQSGGVSGYVSALAIYQEIQRRNPELIPVLCRGYYYHLFGEHAPGESPVTKHRLPVFSVHQGYLTVHYLRAFIEFACQEQDTPLTSEEQDALDLFDEIAHSEDFAISFVTEPGEAVIFNNATVLHNRTAFDDAPELSMKRHLLRLWLAAYDPLPKSPLLQKYTGAGIQKQADTAEPFTHEFTFETHKATSTRKST